MVYIRVDKASNAVEYVKARVSKCDEEEWAKVISCVAGSNTCTVGVGCLWLST